jgi:glutathione S-transferase
MTLQEPLFATYAIAASLMVLKYMGQAWITVFHMLKNNAGMLNPEDLNKGLTNPEPDPAQLDPHPDVERSRRMQRNDMENIPTFLVMGLIFVWMAPPLWLAQTLLYGFVAARAAHFMVYASARSHEERATFFTIGSLIVMGMAGYVLFKAIG